MWLPHRDAHQRDALTQPTSLPAFVVPIVRSSCDNAVKAAILTIPRWNPRGSAALMRAEFRFARAAPRWRERSRRGEPLCVSFPIRRFQDQIPKDRKPHQDAKPSSHREEKRDREARHERQEARHERQREASKAQREAGQPMPESTGELPPLIRRQEMVAIALVGLLAIAVVAVLYLAKAFFLPVIMAFVVGTMLSPIASFLERYRVPRGVGAVLIVMAVARIRHLHRRTDCCTRHGMGLAAAGARRTAEGQAAYLRPAAGAVARAADHARRLRPARNAANAEIRMGAADAGIPVADLHRIPAVLRDAAAVHRELEGSAPRHDHGLSATGLRGCARCASSTRSRNISAVIC